MLKNVSDILKFNIKASPFYTLIIFIIQILQPLLNIALIFVIAMILDVSKNALLYGFKITDIIMPMVFMSVILIYNNVSRQLFNICTTKLEIKLRENIRPIFTRKKACLKYEYVECSDTWNMIQRITKNLEKDLSSAYASLISLICVFVRIIGVLIILFSISKLSALIILILSILLFNIAFKVGQKKYKAIIDTSIFQRRCDYVEEVLTERGTSEERTFFSYMKKEVGKWSQQYGSYSSMENESNKIMFMSISGSGIITTIFSTFIYIILIYMVANNTMSVSLCIPIITELSELIRTMTYRFNRMMADLAKNIKYIDDMNNFLKLPEDAESIEKPCITDFCFERLEFKNVYFKYPGTDKYILKNLSFVVERGKKYSFVAENGAGKSTITKLIIGLYDNYEGQILLNGIDIREYKKSQLKSMIYTVFQDYAKYQISAIENIMVGNINKLSTEYKDDLTDKEGINLLSDIIASLPNGLESNLGKIKEDSVDISLGQWQKIILARSTVSNAQIKIFDEPTASLDPISECNLYENFDKLSKNCTPIFISHRLGSTKLADIIMVIGDGAIVEIGTHDELIRKNNIYARMYNIQKEWYEHE